MADSPRPPFVGDESALLILDWSWWLNKAFRLTDLEGMTSCIVGWLCALLSYEPAHICLALDSPGATFRDKMRHPSDPEWRYKGGRDPKPEDFFRLSSRCTELAELHGIPALWADGYEADDVIATVSRKARAAGYRVWICSDDKDLSGLVEDDPHYGVLCGLWHNTERRTRGPAEVREKFGVEPHQIADWLAIVGDSGDNIPGVPGLGPVKAAGLLQAYGDLETALAAPVQEVASLELSMKRATAALKKAEGADKDRITRERAILANARGLAKNHAALVEHAETVRFARQLTALDFDAPVDVPWWEIPLGGYQVDELRARYKALGFDRKGFQVAAFRKRAPWAVGC